MVKFEGDWTRLLDASNDPPFSTYVDVIQTFMLSIETIIEDETQQWINEFRNSASALEGTTGTATISTKAPRTIAHKDAPPR